MTSDPFDHMVAVVTVVMPLEHQQQQQQAALDTTRRHTGKTALLRAALARGGQYADDLCRIADLANSGRVYSLLKSDIKRGLVRYTNGLYEKVRT